MKYAFFLIFIILISCTQGKKVYICGDRPCLDKKEFQEYFAENLIYEIKTKKSKEYKNVNLVKLNQKKKDKKIKNNIENSLNKKERKALLKKERIRLKNERKAKAIKAKEIAIEKKKLAKQAIIDKKKIAKHKKNKINNKSSKKPAIFKKKANNNPDLSEEELKIITKKTKTSSTEIFSNKVKTETNKNICSSITDCNIDTITELLIKKGKEKDFPDITLR